MDMRRRVVTTGPSHAAGTTSQDPRAERAEVTSTHGASHFFMMLVQMLSVNQ